MIKASLKMNQVQRSEEITSLTSVLKKVKEACESCHSLTPVACITRCDVWKIKRDFRKLYTVMENPNYMINLLNSLKNKRRLQILEILSSKKMSILRLQQKLKKLGYSHSQQTIIEEYLNPLVEVGLAEKDSSSYYATLFGMQLNELLKSFRSLSEILPARSECHEETVLGMLLYEPKTYNDLKEAIPAKTIRRVLARLQKTGLIETRKEKEYTFYFRTRRDPNKVTFSPTEKRIYDKIPTEGISARKLKEKTGISLRRTYKYLGTLRRKKLVFTRKKPRRYTLSAKGFRVATILERIHGLAVETLSTAALLVKDKGKYESLMPDTSRRGRRKKRRNHAPLITKINVEKADATSSKNVL